MFSEDGYLGCPSGVESLRTLSDRLNAKVVEQVSETQELVMMNSFARENSEYQFKRSLQERISDIVSWRWVLEDLSKRLEEAIGTLQYEHNALRVVVERVQVEIDEHSREASRPGALKPFSDLVEDSILKEYDFLKEQKKKFEKLIPELDKQTDFVKKTKKRIEDDILKKDEAITVEESCGSIDINSSSRIGNPNSESAGNKKKKKASPLIRWENRCASLKKAGLKALNDALLTKQKTRGARIQLSVAAQAYANRVDSALKRRLHSNHTKLEELSWQKDETLKDLQALNDELVTTEQNLLETLDQESVIQARLADRTLRPAGELTSDEVDKKLRDELGRLRRFAKQLRSNIERITTLQNNLAEALMSIDSHAEDIIQVARLDEERIRSRLGEDSKRETGTSPVVVPQSSSSTATSGQRSTSRELSMSRSRCDAPLMSIKEEDEDDDYPFDD